MTTGQDRVVVFTPPVEIDQPCRHCGEPLAATKGYRRNGRRDCLAWTHVRTGEQICRMPVCRATPRDVGSATELVNAALRGQWAADRALDEALDLIGDQS